MSIKTIKSDLETYLRLNVTAVAIKWNNTNIFTLNGVQLNQSQIDSLNFFIEPKIINISSDRELMSTSDFVNYNIFFQLNLYNKINTGTGLVYSTIDDLNALFREMVIGSTTCFSTKTIGSFIEGEYEITPHRVLCGMYGG